MPKSVPHHALVVVADGHGAILLRNEGPAGDVSLREERRLSPKNLRDEGPSGSRPPEQTPLHRQTRTPSIRRESNPELFLRKIH
ncbi:host attachment family protein [Mesorhizobium sp. NBSH29]|uniref:host attachment family protein n=1 Tax=Mesorhizobium sp. NBSH29 TaxID=2654249 RepID=UPI001CA47D5C|nr:host attachment family protein [Mesorhizobium sp. NBSH29]